MALTKVKTTGLADGTDGQVITYDANGNPVAVGPGTDGQVLTSTGAGSPPAFEAASGGISDIVSDTSPQLGGDLDIQARKVTTSTTNGNVALEPNGTGKTIVGTGSANAVVESNDSANNALHLQASHAKVVIGSGANGTIQVTADGTGTVDLISDSRKTKLGIGALEETLTTHQSGAHIKIEPAGTSGNITVKSGANEDIELTPNGTGDVVIDGLKYPQADGSAGQFLKTDGSAQLSWDSAGGLDGVTTGSGNVTITDGNLILADGHGIDFSATADANAGGETISDVNEVLDDYEEGRWTPTLMYSGAANCTTNAYSPKGRYVKIGQLVFVSGYIALTAKGSDNGSGTLEIHGLPFASDQYGQPDRPAYSGYSGYFENFSVTEIAIIWGNNNDKCYITGNVSSNNQILSYSHLTDTSWIAFSMTYRANA